MYNDANTHGMSTSQVTDGFSLPSCNTSPYQSLSVCICSIFPMFSNEKIIGYNIDILVYRYVTQYTYIHTNTRLSAMYYCIRTYVHAIYTCIYVCTYVIDKHTYVTHIHTVEYSYNKPEIPGQTVCYKQEFVISEQFPMRYCSTWLRSLLCYIKKFVIEEFVIRVFHSMYILTR